MDEKDIKEAIKEYQEAIFNNLKLKKIIEDSQIAQKQAHYKEQKALERLLDLRKDL